MSADRLGRLMDCGVHLGRYGAKGFHLAHKAENAVDLETGAVVAVTIQPADRGDTQSYEQTLSEALENLAAVVEQAELPEQVLC
jgi:hypothetical protein